MQNTLMDSNVAGGPLLSTGVGGSIYAQDSCSSGICTSVTCTIAATNITNSYAHLVCSHADCKIYAGPGATNYNFNGNACPCKQAGAGIFYNGASSISSFQLNNSLIANNYVDSPFTGSEGINGLGGKSSKEAFIENNNANALEDRCRRTGGAILLQNNFDLEAVDFVGNSAYFGGAIFISANLSVNADLDTITFTSNTAALGAHATS